MTQKLCWKCKEYLMKKYESSFYTIPSIHCHHDEPEEKPLCWCQRNSMLLLELHIEKPGMPGKYTKLSAEPPNFCPRCGRKIVEENAP